jgi:hypothetical protein
MNGEGSQIGVPVPGCRTEKGHSPWISHPSQPLDRRLALLHTPPIIQENGGISQELDQCLGLRGLLSNLGTGGFQLDTKIGDEILLNGLLGLGARALRIRLDGSLGLLGPGSSTKACRCEADIDGLWFHSVSSWISILGGF